MKMKVLHFQKSFFIDLDVIDSETGTSEGGQRSNCSSSKGNKLRKIIIIFTTC